MKKKKLLFLITNANIFTGFFLSDTKELSKNFDIYFVVSSYGFDNVNFYNSKINLFTELKKKKIIKKIIFVNEVNYINVYQNIKFNIKLISIINEIKLLKIDYFLLPSMFYYWEEIFFNVFKDKKIYCYLPSAPSGLDYFNSFKDFKKSFREKKIYRTFTVKSDSIEFHQQNTKSLNKKNLLNFLFQKINIFLSKQINHIILPILLYKKIININSIYYKLNINFLKFKKIIIFNEETKNFLSKLSLKKNKKIYFCSNNYTKKKIKNFNWVYLYSSKDKDALVKLFECLKILKKLKKINRIDFKGHPTWKHENIKLSFFYKLKKEGINYRILDSYKNINYPKYYGLISKPSTVILESTYNKPSIKTIIISGTNHVSGMLNKFYKSNKKNNLWDPTYGELKKYLKKNNQPKINSNDLKKIILNN